MDVTDGGNAAYYWQVTGEKAISSGVVNLRCDLTISVVSAAAFVQWNCRVSVALQSFGIFRGVRNTVRACGVADKQDQIPLALVLSVPARVFSGSHSVRLLFLATQMVSSTVTGSTSLLSYHEEVTSFPWLRSSTLQPGTAWAEVFFCQAYPFCLWKEVRFEGRGGALGRGP